MICYFLSNILHYFFFRINNSLTPAVIKKSTNNDEIKKLTLFPTYCLKKTLTTTVTAIPIKEIVLTNFKFEYLSIYLLSPWVPNIIIYPLFKIIQKLVSFVIYIVNKFTGIVDRPINHFLKSSRINI